MTPVADVRIRKARKDYPCGRQAYYDRLKTPEKRDWYGASPCPLGGVINAGEQYAETEGSDSFHPGRSHIDCEPFPHD